MHAHNLIEFEQLLADHSTDDARHRVPPGTEEVVVFVEPDLPEWPFLVRTTSTS